MWLPICLTLLVYSPVLGFDFVNWDDPVYVQHNWHIRDWSLRGWGRIFTLFEVNGNYHPITLLSYALDYKCWQNDPFGYHLSNLILHGINIGLVYWVFGTWTGRWFIGLLVALGLALHPMHAESVAWISGRKDLLYVGFLLVSWLAWWRSKSAGGSKQLLWVIVSLLAFTLSLLSKAQAVVFPILLLLSDHWHGKLHQRKLWLEKLPYFILSIGFGLLAIQAQQHSKALTEVSNWPLLQSIFLAGTNLWIYLLKVAVPYSLAGFHPHGQEWAAGTPIYAIFCTTGWVLTGAFFVWKHKTYPKITSGLAWFIVALLPVSQLLPVGMAQTADRYSYLSYLAIYVLLAWAILELYSKSRKKASLLWIQGIVLFLLCAGMALGTSIYLPSWKNGVTFWSQVIKEHPQHHFAWYNRGHQFDMNGQTDQALSDFNQAIVLAPNFADVYDNRGQLWQRQSQFDAALQDYNQAIALDSGLARSWLNRAYLRNLMDGPNIQVEQDLQQAIELKPEYGLAFRNLGVYYEQTKQMGRALKTYSSAIEIEPLNSLHRQFRGLVYLKSNQIEAALDDFDAAISLAISTDLKQEKAHSLYLRSKAHWLLKDKENAQKDLLQALEMGEKVRDKNYLKLVLPDHPGL